MTEIAIELDDETAKRLSEASEKDGLTPSAWAKRAIRMQLEERLPDSFFAVLGTWEDDRSTEEIFRDIREEAPQAQRMTLKRDPSFSSTPTSRSTSSTRAFRPRPRVWPDCPQTRSV